MAYRLADWERWQQMDFVVGIRIQLSNNHTCLGKDGEPHPFHDICDELEGEYPKTFKWVGWHPQCRCNAVPILKTVDEKIADNMAKRNGQAPAKESVNSVKRMPKAFTDWIKDNKNRIAAAKSQPYFIRDNATEVSKIIPGVLPESMMPATPVLSIAERAQMRHDARTPEQIADIRRRWTLREAEIRHAARTPEQVESIKNAWNERRQKAIVEAGRELNSWADGYLPVVMLGKFHARRLILNDPENGSQVILNKTFFKEVINKHKDDALYLEKLKYCRDIAVLFEKARYVRDETSASHPDAIFRVYETEAGNYIAEIKVKCNSDGQIIYIMRLLNKK